MTSQVTGPLTRAAAAGAAERQPLLRANVGPEQQSDRVRQRIVMEVTDAARRHWIWVVPLFLCFVVLAALALWGLIRAIIAVLKYEGVPCDVPLNMYLVVLVVWKLFSDWILKLIQFYSGNNASVYARIPLNIPSWCIIAWGFYMVQSSESCAKTNPDLFYDTRDFIYIHACYSFVHLWVSIACIFGYRWVLRLFMQMSATPGCVAAVRKLPKISKDSEELIDRDTGWVMECSICISSLATDEVVVQAPCGHLYHEECLVPWCQSHSDCPLCRAQIGDLDPSPASGSTNV